MSLAKSIEEAKRNKTERDRKKQAPKTEEEAWAKKEAAVSAKWEAGTITWDDFVVSVQIVGHKYKQWGAAALRWIRKHPVPFITTVLVLFIVRFIVKKVKSALWGKKKEPDTEDNNKKEGGGSAKKKKKNKNKNSGDDKKNN